MAKKSDKNVRKVPAWKKRQIIMQQKIKRRAAVSTGVFFLALFVVFMFIALKPPVPRPEAKGVSVMLGKDAVGATEQLRKIQKTAETAQKKTEQKQKSEPEKSIDKPVTKKPDEGDVPINRKTEEKKKAEEEEKKKTEEKKQTEEKEKEKTKEEDKKPELDPRADFGNVDKNKGDDGKKGMEGEKKGVKEGKSKGEKDNKKKGMALM